MRALLERRATWLVIAIFAPSCTSPDVQKATLPQYDSTRSSAPLSASDSGSSPRPSMPSISDGVRMVISLDSASGSRPVVRAHTNLPEGTLLQVTLESKEWDYKAEGLDTLDGPEMTFGPFSDGDNDLLAGRYAVSIGFVTPDPLPRTWGPLVATPGQRVHPSTISSNQGRQAVTYEYSFAIGDSTAHRGAVIIAKDRERQRRLAVKALAEDLRALAKKGLAMEPLRKSDDLEAGKACGVAFRQNYAEVQALHRRFDSLPVPRPWGLSMALTDVGPCVTCLKDAGEACRRVDADLRLPEPE
jgi:hypothetical protein